jgi:hypothetical protein
MTAPTPRPSRPRDVGQLGATLTVLATAYLIATAFVPFLREVMR